MTRLQDLWFWSISRTWKPQGVVSILIWLSLPTQGIYLYELLTAQKNQAEYCMNQFLRLIGFFPKDEWGNLYNKKVIQIEMIDNDSRRLYKITQAIITLKYNWVLPISSMSFHLREKIFFCPGNIKAKTKQCYKGKNRFFLIFSLILQ